MHRILPVLLSIVWTSACDSGPATGPGEVRWDRETCTRCAMSIGDNRFAAQLRERADPYRLFAFDDIGCAVIWLERQPDAGAEFEIWVNDHRTAQWIDARRAWFVKGIASPMGYNLAASLEPAGGAVDFDSAVRHVREVEAGRQIHGGGHKVHLQAVEQ